jgi:8-oxo-dGTP pyrophosphatase MutT (NUDIX family)
VNTSPDLNFQFAALPYRHLREATLEVMLITSRDTGRWVLPKGWPAEREAAWDCAAREAREEAGIIGEIQVRPLGRYHYRKVLDSGFPVWCTVEVFPLAFIERLASWSEQGERLSRWFAVEDAANAVEEPELGAIIRDLPNHLRGPG